MDIYYYLYIITKPKKMLFIIDDKSIIFKQLVKDPELKMNNKEKQQH